MAVNLQLDSPKTTVLSDPEVRGIFMVSVADALEISGKIVRKLNTSVRTVQRRTALRSHPSFRPAPGSEVDVLLNFPGDPVNLYQIRQWYGPLEHLAKTYSVAILCYQPDTAEIVSRETDLKVVLTPSYTDLREVVDDLKPKVILYPNQNYANYRILGITSAEHVFISHGESDKIYMASNWVKVFNYFFVAGEASRDRLRKHVRNYDVDARTLPIGRPQIDIKHESPLEKSSELITVLYAPTWEGGRRTMRYGSVASHGVGIVASLLSDERFRLVYRPHPRTGITDVDFAEADKQIKGLIRTANEEKGDIHLVDSSPFGWQLDVADVMITDISAVAYDWLTTAKPLLVTEPAEPQAVMPHNGFMTEAPLLTASDASNSAQILDTLLDDQKERAKLERWADYYYGSRSPGQSLSRFTFAVDQVINERALALGKQLATESASSRDQGIEGKALQTPQIPGIRAAANALTFAARSTSFAITGIANVVAQSRGESHLIDAADSAMKRRKADIVVSTMAGPHDIHLLLEWLPALEIVNRTHSLAILTGNQRTYHRLRFATDLRVHIGRNASETEEIFSALAPKLHLQFEQANLNLRELTHRNLKHAYVGSDGDSGWINNRLRAFDAIIVSEEILQHTVRSSMIDFPQSTILMAVRNSLPLNDARAIAIDDILRAAEH